MVTISGCLWNESVSELQLWAELAFCIPKGQLLSMCCGLRCLGEISSSQSIFPKDILEKSDLGFLICEVKGWTPWPLALVLVPWVMKRNSLGKRGNIGPTWGPCTFRGALGDCLPNSIEQQAKIRKVSKCKKEIQWNYSFASIRILLDISKTQKKKKKRSFESWISLCILIGKFKLVFENTIKDHQHKLGKILRREKLFC